MNILRVFILVTALFSPEMLFPAVIHIPGDHPTIQAGIEAAVDGDTVLVADGTYTGPGNRDIEFGNKSITVKSVNGPENCIIDCQGSELEPHRGFVFSSDFLQDAILQGFTIKNGYVPYPERGGGIYCDGYQSSPTIANNIIMGNTAWIGGGISCLNSSEPLIINNQIIGNSNRGISSAGSSPTIDGNIISENTSSGITCAESSFPTITGNIISNNEDASKGGGISCSESMSIIDGNIVVNNSSYREGGGLSINYGSATISNNLIMGNTALGQDRPFGGGISLEYTEVTTLISGNTIIDNIALRRGGGLYVADGSRATITNTILWNNLALNGKEIYVAHSYSGASQPHINYSDIDGGEESIFVQPGSVLTIGDGMIDADPLFLSGPLGDCYLSQVAAGQAEDSPCLDAGDPDSDMTWGTTRTDHVHDTAPVDMGFHYPWQSVRSQLACIPSTGTLPLPVQFGAQVTNNFLESDRLFAAQIDVALASGMEIPSWKSGTVTIGQDDSFSTVFNSIIPMLPQLVGENTFTLTAEDVTPSPYNQPPYAPSGDVDTSDCTVTGIAP